MEVDVHPATAIQTCVELMERWNADSLVIHREDGTVSRIPGGEVLEALALGWANAAIGSLVENASFEGLAPPGDAVVTSVFAVWMPPDSILRVAVREGAEISIEALQETFSLADMLVSRAEFGVLVDLRGMRSMDRSARDYLRSREGGLGVALLVDSAIARLVANFFMGLKRGPRTPTRMFAVPTEAVEWLKQLRSSGGDQRSSVG